MPARDDSYLLDILNASRWIMEFVEGLDEGAFLNDIKTQSAVIRQLEVIGEATKRLSGDIRTTHPDIPWRSIAGMRDILIHAYDHVDIQQVWQATQQDIPNLIEKIEPLIN